MLYKSTGKAYCRVPLGKEPCVYIYVAMFRAVDSLLENTVIAQLTTKFPAFYVIWKVHYCLHKNPPLHLS